MYVCNFLSNISIHPKWPFPSNNVFLFSGIFLVLIGSSLYTYVKITEVQKAPAKHESGKPLLPK